MQYEAFLRSIAITLVRENNEVVWKKKHFLIYGLEF